MNCLPKMSFRAFWREFFLDRSPYFFSFVLAVYQQNRLRLAVLRPCCQWQLFELEFFIRFRMRQEGFFQKIERTLHAHLIRENNVLL